MRYDISEYINLKDPLYIKGCFAIERRDETRLSAVLTDKDFDNSSFEALGLLFKAAERAYIKGFQMLGDAGVRISQPLKVERCIHYVQAYRPRPFEPVLLTRDKTALHVLMENINLENLRNINLLEHFQEPDIERTLNTYALGCGTPLQIAYQKHIEGNRYLKEKNIKRKSESFLDFYVQMMHVCPNVQAPLIAGDEMLFQKAVRLKDLDALSVIGTHSVLFLNMLLYKYTKEEYEMLQQFDLPKEWKERMQKGFSEEPIAKKQSLSSKLKNLFCLIKPRTRN